MRAAAGLTACAVALLFLSVSGTRPAASAALPAAIESAAAVPPEERIDINHATLAELLRIPGITQTWAARIVRFRPYRTRLDLQDRGVVSDEVYDRIKEYIIAHREKTLRPEPAQKHEGDGPKPVPFMQFPNSK